MLDVQTRMFIRFLEKEMVIFCRRRIQTQKEQML